MTLRDQPYPVVLQYAQAEDVKDRQFASTLASGIDILLAFRVGDSVLGNKELASRTGLSKSTVARLTHTLCLLGYLRAEPSCRKYRLGAANLTLGHPVLVNMSIRQVARGSLRALADSVGGIASLARHAHSRMIYVESAVSSESAGLNPDIGSPLPILTTSCGRAWLCGATSSEANTTLNRIRLQDPEEFARLTPALETAKREYKKLGYCASRGDWNPGIHAYASPLRRQIDGQFFVVNCAIRAAVSDTSANEREREVTGALLDTVQKIEALIGTD
jgi:DNA-binding IclR family transcriptional regulator